MNEHTKGAVIIGIGMAAIVTSILGIVMHGVHEQSNDQLVSMTFDKIQEVENYTHDDCDSVVRWVDSNMEEFEGYSDDGDLYSDPYKSARFELFSLRYDKAKELGCYGLIDSDIFNSLKEKRND